jgi:hypothetical protein
VLADNDPAEQEKLITFNTLLGNLVIFHNALDIMDVVRGLVAEGWTITAAGLGALSPYLRGQISRFGAYATDELGRQPGAFNPVLKEVDFTTPASPPELVSACDEDRYRPDLMNFRPDPDVRQP